MHITPLFAGLFALMIVPLSLLVTMRRMKTATTLGDGDDLILRRRIRAHGNFVENVPLALIALGLLEVSDGSPMFVWSVGLAFLLSRILHACGLLGDVPKAQGAGMLLLHSAFVVSGLSLVLDFIR